MAGTTEITQLLAHRPVVIAYEPLRTEVSFSDLFTLSPVSVRYDIPARASLDPEAEARKVCALADSQDTALLIPGRTFDSSGTRHGQGGGWYDRFLANVPRTWLRIGFCYDDQFSTSPLKRETWDQAMDYVVVVSRKTGAVTLYSSEGELP